MNSFFKLLLQNIKSLLQRILSHVTKIFVSHLREYFHWIVVFIPLLSIVINLIFGIDKEKLHIGLAVFTIVFNIVILLLRAYLEENNELRLFYTFIWNYLPPIKEKRELLFDTNVTIIEDENNSYYYNTLAKKFKNQPIISQLDPNLAEEANYDSLTLTSTRKKIEISPIIDKPLFNYVPSESINGKNLVDDEKEVQENNLKEKLKNYISDSKAIVVVRTPALDAKPWVYEAVESWAKKNSESPCIFVLKKDQKYAKDPIADNFLWIYDGEPKSLPWKLLQRAKDRSAAWHIQAKYNWAWAVNFLLILGLILEIFVLQLVHQSESGKHDIETKQKNIAMSFENARKENGTFINNLFQEKDKNIKENTEKGNKNNKYEERINKDIKNTWLKIAQQIRDEYKISYTNFEEKDVLEVSFWFFYNQNAQEFVTTEEADMIDHFPIEPQKEEDKSIIGCGFDFPNNFVTWEEKLALNVWGFDDTNKKNESLVCQMKPRDNAPIKKIVCVSYNKDSPSPMEKTVGVCIFTKSSKDIFRNGYRNFLQTISREVYEILQESTKQKLLPLIQETEGGSIKPIKP